MRKLLLTTLIAISSLIMILTGCSSNSEQTLNIEATELESITENETELVKEETTEAITEPTEIEYTEDEYKALCSEKYYDDFFKYSTMVGEYVKVYAMVSDKYEYSSSDMFGILTEDITDKYNLEMNCVVCSVLHKETKNDNIPSYFGKHIYVALEKYYTYSINQFKQGQKIIIYGEVIKNSNEYFILPKYIEWE